MECLATQSASSPSTYCISLLSYMCCLSCIVRTYIIVGIFAAFPMENTMSGMNTTVPGERTKNSNGDGWETKAA